MHTFLQHFYHRLNRINIWHNFDIFVLIFSYWYFVHKNLEIPSYYLHILYKVIIFYVLELFVAHQHPHYDSLQLSQIITDSITVSEPIYAILNSANRSDSPKWITSI